MFHNIQNDTFDERKWLALPKYQTQKLKFGILKY